MPCQMFRTYAVPSLRDVSYTVSVTTDDYTATSNLLRLGRARILAVWGDLVRDKLPGTELLSTPTLLNHLPIFLDGLAKQLDKKAATGTDAANAECGEDHGRERARLAVYSLGDVIREYRVLRQVLFKVIETDDFHLPRADRDIILDTFEDAMADAAESFFEHRSEMELRARAALSAMLTHDLRNQLTVLQAGSARVAADPQASDEMKRISAIIARNIERSNALLRDLLDLRRIQAGHPVPLKREACDLNEILGECLKDARLLYGERFRYFSPGSFNGHWSPGGLKRIFDNLLGNAAKYAEEDSPITVSVAKLSGVFEVKIHNVGEALTAADIALIFDDFHRLETAQRQSDHGWGIGLAVVRSLVEAHKGTIDVTSDPVRGTTFAVRLPEGSK